LRGRMIERADDKPGCGAAGPVAVVSYDFWKNRLGSDRNVIGSTLKLERHPFQVIGVSPPWFTGLELDKAFDVAVPMGCEPAVDTEHSRLRDANSWWLRIVGRLKSGQTIEQASAQLAAAEPEIYGGIVPASLNEGEQSRQERTLSLESAATGFSSTAGQYRTALFTLMAAVVLVLLIACANIANLLIARAAIRRREFSVRLAIGASRGRVARQLLTESVLLSLIGAAAGALLAFWGSKLLVSLLSTAQERIDVDVSPDARVLAFTAGVAIMAGLLFGIAPAWRGATSGVGAALRENSRGRIAGGSSFRLGKALVAVQVALSLVLLSGAVAFSGSLRNLLTQDLGFDRQNVLLVRASASAGRIPLAQLPGIVGNMLESVRRLPQVRSASASVLTPVGDMVWTGDVYPEGYDRKGPEDALLYFNRVTPGYFETLRTRLLLGRDFTDRDSLSAPGVMIISRSAARKFWGDANPIGKVIRTDRLGKAGEFDSFHVVGVVADIKYGHLDEQPVMTAYYPMAQQREPFAATVLEIRSAVPVQALVPEIHSMAGRSMKDMTTELQTLDEQVKDSLVQARLLALISGFFGFVALLLAVTGLYGVIAYTTARRRSEIGIRVALGAEFASVIWLIVRDVGIMVSAGVLAGIAVSLAAGRLVQSLVYGLKPSDPVVLGATAAVLAVAAAVAAWLPARRAARMDPMSALRNE
jgi:putative ABC transport system permease protein